jgi:hypothetical protein
MTLQLESTKDFICFVFGLASCLVLFNGRSLLSGKEVFFAW